MSDLAYMIGFLIAMVWVSAILVIGTLAAGGILPWGRRQETSQVKNSTHYVIPDRAERPRAA